MILMPEIAEVETVRNTLKGRILNKKITDVKVHYKNMIESDINTFVKDLVNDEFIDIKRKGKRSEEHTSELQSH